MPFVRQSFENRRQPGRRQGALSFVQKRLPGPGRQGQAAPGRGPRPAALAFVSLRFRRPDALRRATQRNAFANLESDDPGVMLGRRSLRKAADAMGRAATMLMILPCVAGVLQMFVLAFNRVPLPGLAIFLAIYLVFSVFLLALPVTFMLLGASALRKTSSLGLAVTGAVFAVLVGGLLALGALGAAVSIVAGNLGGLVGATGCRHRGLFLHHHRDPDVQGQRRPRSPRGLRASPRATRGGARAAEGLTPPQSGSPIRRRFAKTTPGRAVSPTPRRQPHGDPPHGATGPFRMLTGGERRNDRE